MKDMLCIEFISGAKKLVFQLEYKSYYPLESGGILWSNTFNLELTESFYSFWKYIKERYGEETVQVSNPMSATIEQKREGIDTKGYPWIHKLSVKDEKNTEVCIFHPFTCDRAANLEQEDNEDE